MDLTNQNRSDLFFCLAYALDNSSNSREFFKIILNFYYGFASLPICDFNKVSDKARRKVTKIISNDMNLLKVYNDILNSKASMYQKDEFFLDFYKIANGDGASHMKPEMERRDSDFYKTLENFVSIFFLKVVEININAFKSRITPGKCVNIYRLCDRWGNDFSFISEQSPSELSKSSFGFDVGDFLLVKAKIKEVKHTSEIYLSRVYVEEVENGECI